MRNTGFKLATTFFEGLLHRLDAERRRVNDIWGKALSSRRGYYSDLLGRIREQYPLACIPSLEHLAELVEVAFWTSLQHEEGRSLSFSVGYEQPSSGASSTIRFRQPICFDARNLTKLAPAVGSAEAALMVAPSSEGSLQIWGLSLYAGPLAIKVLDPGQLIVSFALTNIAAISGAEAVFIRSPLLTRGSSIWAKFEPHNSIWSDPRTDTILDIARSMRALGHGGALIVVPDDDRWKDSVELPILYSGEEHFAAARKALDYLKEDQEKSGENLEQTILWKHELERLAKLIARFTAVDGATLMTRNLEVIGFGVTLKAAPDAEGPHQIWRIDPLDHEEWFKQVALDEIGHHRHKSAARFIFNQRDALAFVVSQDGNVTAFVWEEPEQLRQGAVYAYSRLELTLF